MKIAALLLLLAGVTSTAVAGPYTMTTPMVTQTPMLTGGPYLTVNGGPIWFTGFSAHGADLDFDTGWAAMLAFGYELNNGVAFEVETGYAQGGIGDVTYHGQRVGVDGDFRQIPLLANVVFNIPVSHTVALYLGAGLGIARNETDIDSVQAIGVDLGSEDWSFAWQAKAGLSFDLSQALSLNVGYRFLYGLEGYGSEQDSKGHMAEGGITFRF